MLKILFICYTALYLNVANAFEEEKCIMLGRKTCVDEGTRAIDGFEVKKCWESKEEFIPIPVTK